MKNGFCRVMKRVTLSKIFSLICLLLWMTMMYAQNSGISASVNKDKLTRDDHVELRIAISGDNPTQGLVLAPLQNDFNILSRGQSQQIQIINGHTHNKIEILLLLTPKKSGKLTIPALIWGQYQTAPIAVEVTEEAVSTVNPMHAASSAAAVANRQASGKAPTSAASAPVHDDIFMETNIAPLAPYENSQMRYTIKIFSTLPIHNGQLTQPSGDNIWIFPETGEQHYEATLNNKTYSVFERNYAIFPKKAGTLILHSPQFVGSSLESFFSTHRSFSRFDDQPITLKNPAKKLQIKAKITQPGRAWLPAQALTVSDSWGSSPTQAMKVGEPIERTVTLYAKGLTLMQLPQFAWQSISGLKMYPGKVTTEERFDGEYVVSQRVQTITYLATRAGSFTIPEIQLPWFNVNKEKTEFAKIAALSLSTPTYSHAATSSAQLSLPDSIGSSAETLPVTSMSQPVVHSSPANSTTHDSITISKMGLIYSLLGIVSVLLILICVRFFTRTRSSGSSIESLTAKGRRSALKKACYAGDLPSVRQTLYAWLHHQDTTLSPAKRTALTAQLQQLDNYLYSNFSLPSYGDGRAIWRNLKKLC